MAVMYASCSLRMEGEESVACGHHIYKEVWRPVVGQELPLIHEPNNRHDRRTIAVYMDGEVGSSESTETRSR